MTNKRISILISLCLSIVSGILFGIVIDIEGLFWLSFFWMIISLIVLFVYLSDERKSMVDNYIKETDEYISTNNVTVSKSVFSDTISSRIIFDHENKLLHILKYQKSSIIIPYSKIEESELIENGNTITKTSRGSQVAGVVVGGILGGTVGSVIGGLSANTKSSREMKKLELKIITDDLHSPVNNFYIKDSINEYEKDSVMYRSLYDTAYEVHKIISIIIKNNK